MTKTYHFGPAFKREKWVYGATRPGFPQTYPQQEAVEQWLNFMQAQGISAVCCLLSPEQVQVYPHLIQSYAERFGADAVSWCAIEDFHLADKDSLRYRILPFLADCVVRRKKVVVHCSAGLGRTGHVLAAWLAYSRGYEPEEAIRAVVKMGRNPYEAVGRYGEKKQQLHALLTACWRPSLHLWYLYAKGLMP